MDAAVIVALVTAMASIVVALISGFLARRSGRATERLRQSNEARSRLHVATGALQLELFLETRSFARRLIHYFSESKEDHDLATTRRGARPGAYHAGGLMIYRMLRPLTVGEIIEKQTLAADLLLDPAMADMLRFSHAGVEMLTGEEIGRGLEGEEWLPGFDMDQCWDPGHDEGIHQRIRGSYLRCGAAALLAKDAMAGEEPRRCITHAEFCKAWEHPEDDEEFHEALEPMKRIVDGFNWKDNPIFWLRLVGYAYACEWFYDRMRAWVVHRGVARRVKDTLTGRDPVEYRSIDLPLDAMLRAAGAGVPANGYLGSHAGAYRARFDRIIRDAL
jgi:hypothetical protein